MRTCPDRKLAEENRQRGQAFYQANKNLIRKIRDDNRQRKIDRGQDPDGVHEPPLHQAIPHEPQVVDPEERYHQSKRQRVDEEVQQTIDVKFNGELVLQGHIEKIYILM